MLIVTRPITRQAWLMQILRRDLPIPLPVKSDQYPDDHVPADAFMRGHDYWGHGAHSEAFACWFHALLYQPHRVDLLLSLGTACRENGWLDYGELFCRRAIDVGTGLDLAAAHTNLGNILLLREHWTAARLHFADALEIEPDLTWAQRGMCEVALHTGELLTAINAVETFAQMPGATRAELAHLQARIARLSGRMNLSRDWLSKAIVYRPSNRRAWRELALSASRDDVAAVLCQQLAHLHQRAPEALGVAARSALSALLTPPLSDAVPEFLAHVRPLLGDAVTLYESAARALHHSGCTATAARVCRDALLLPSLTTSLLELTAVLFARQGRADEARQYFAQALRMSPTHPSLLTNVSYFLFQSGDIDRAIFFARLAVAARDHSGQAHCFLALAYAKIFQLRDAVAVCLEGLSLRGIPIITRAALWRTMGEILLNQGKHKQAAHALGVANELFDGQSPSAIALAYLCRDDVSAEILAQVHRAAGAFYETSFAATRRRNWSNGRLPNRKLRVGLVSPNLHRHPVGLLLASWLTHVDQQQFELYAYATSPARDTITIQLEDVVTRWRHVYGQSPNAIAGIIGEDAIDILIDLSGHSDGATLDVFALKPAPIQLSWAGYAFSTGMHAIDGVIQDRFSAPAGSEQLYVERIVRLPCMTYCYVPPPPLRPVQPTPALRRGYVTFGCFNQVAKITEHTLILWARVLVALPTSRLYLKAESFADIEVRDTMRAKLCALGIQSERVRIEQLAPSNDCDAAYDEVDIALDTYPFNGEVTSLEGLWQGVPLLTRAGALHFSRIGGSMMHALNLSSWVAETDDQFVAAAVAKTLEFEQLNRTRARLRERLATCTLGNGKLFAPRMAQLWRDCWYAYCRQAD
jgi:tetratricopeptide (TPR) repeat protein